MAKLKLLVADDHAIVRAGLRLLINSQPDMEVLADVADGSTALLKLCETAFDIVIMDLSTPGGNACRTIEGIRRKAKQTRVLVLSMCDDPAYLVAVMTAGASGYVSKRSTDIDLLAAIRTLSRGESFIDPSVARSVIQSTALRRAAAHAAGPGRSRPILSQRERQVLELLADGHTNQEVGNRLFISVKTVETHRARLMRKLGLTTRADLIRYARESGMLPSHNMNGDATPRMTG